VGVVDHGAWAVLVTAAADGRVLDRRRVELVEAGLPTHPHHHEAQWALGRYRKAPWARAITMDEALGLIERVRACAQRQARVCLDAVEAEVAGRVGGVALRECPELPPTTRERIADARAQTVADSVMYRQALAAAAAAKGWSVSWYDPRSVHGRAARALADLDERLRAAGKAVGPPWQKDHRIAMAAAIAALARGRA
jgi:hypothetical protein